MIEEDIKIIKNDLRLAKKRINDLELLQYVDGIIIKNLIKRSYSEKDDDR